MKEKVFFENSKGDKLCGILSNPTENKEKPIIILCHGFASNKDRISYLSLEEILNNKNISTFRFDFFAHGESEGNFEDLTISEAVDDVLQAIEFLKKQGYSRIGLQGSSFGGMASIIAASESSDLFVLVLKAPVSDYLGKIISQVTKFPIEEWKEKGFIYFTDKKGEKRKVNYSFFEDAQDVHGFDAATKIKIPTLIVHGDQDQSVPIEQSKKTCTLIENCTLEIIKGADHYFSKPEDKEKQLNLISEFIIEHSK